MITEEEIADLKHENERLKLMCRWHDAFQAGSPAQKIREMCDEMLDLRKELKEARQTIEGKL